MNESLKKNKYLSRSINLKWHLFHILGFIDFYIIGLSVILFPIALKDFNTAVIGICLALILAFSFLFYIRYKNIFYIEVARFYSNIFLKKKEPFLNARNLPKIRTTYEVYTKLIKEKCKSDVVKCIEGALKRGYLINCTIEIHNGITKVALDKEIVKDTCPSCGAPIVDDVVYDIYTCSYCGKKIRNVIKKK